MEIIMNRVLFFLTFISIGALCYGWWYNQSLIKQQETARIQQFINAGARFTAQDGQELCRVVQELARQSKEFQSSGIPLPKCQYGNEHHH